MHYLLQKVVIFAIFWQTASLAGGSRYFYKYPFCRGYTLANRWGRQIGHHLLAHHQRGPLRNVSPVPFFREDRDAAYLFIFPFLPARA